MQEDLSSTAVDDVVAADAVVVVDPSILASKRVIYVGGLADEATTTLVRAAFIPFGNIKSVDMPMDYVAGRHKGFAFVEFDDADDAVEAFFNMDGGELLGRVLKVSLAQLNQASKLSTSTAASGGVIAKGGNVNEAIWKSDEWFQKYAGGQKDEAEKQQDLTREQDAKVLQDR